MTMNIRIYVPAVASVCVTSVFAASHERSTTKELDKNNRQCVKEKHDERVRNRLRAPMFLDITPHDKICMHEEAAFTSMFEGSVW